MSSRKPWSREEAQVLVAIYFASNFSSGDDEHDECRIIADSFGRTPASIDRQWRNIAAVLQEHTDLHIGKLIYDTASEFLADPASAREAALRVANSRAWPVTSLIKKGQLDNNSQLQPGNVEIEAKLKVRLSNLIDHLEYKIFASGAHGYHFSERFEVASRHFSLSISCTLQEQQKDFTVDVKATSAEVSPHVIKLIQDCPVKQFPSGRIGIFLTSKINIKSEQFLVSAQVTELHKGDEVG
jgi:hypothetical protein